MIHKGRFDLFFASWLTISDPSPAALVDPSRKQVLPFCVMSDELSSSVAVKVEFYVFGDMVQQPITLHKKTCHNCHYNCHGWVTVFWHVVLKIPEKEILKRYPFFVISLKQLRTDCLIWVSKTGNIYLSVVANMKPAGLMLHACRWEKWMVLLYTKSPARRGKYY